jgi:hypothetical protein
MTLDLSTVEDATAYWMYLDDMDGQLANSFCVYQMTERILANPTTLRIQFRLEEDHSDNFQMMVLQCSGGWKVKFDSFDYPKRKISAQLFSSEDECILMFRFRDKGNQQVFVHLFTA